MPLYTEHRRLESCPSYCIVCVTDYDVSFEFYPWHSEHTASCFRKYGDKRLAIPLVIPRTISVIFKYTFTESASLSYVSWSSLLVPQFCGMNEVLALIAR